MRTSILALAAGLAPVPEAGEAATAIQPIPGGAEVVPDPALKHAPVQNVISTAAISRTRPTSRPWRSGGRQARGAAGEQ